MATTEGRRLIAWGRRKLARVRQQRDVDAAAGLALIDEISDHITAGSEDAQAQTKLTTLGGILTGMQADTGETPFQSGPNVGPILVQLNGAIADLNLHTSQGRTDGDAHVDAAVVLINALTSEDKTAALAACAAAIVDIAVGTEGGDDAAIAHVNEAIAAVNAF